MDILLTAVHPRHIHHTSKDVTEDFTYRQKDDSRSRIMVNKSGLAHNLTT